MHGHILTAETGKSKCGEKINKYLIGPSCHWFIFFTYLQGFDVSFHLMEDVMILGEVIKKLFFLARENQRTSSPPGTHKKIF